MTKGKNVSKSLILFWCLILAGKFVAQEIPKIEPVVFEPGPNSAPIDWKYYRVSSQKLSVQLPKLPVRNPVDGPCEQKEGAIFQVYAENAVYDFRYYAKREGPSPSDCHYTSKFTKDALAQRLSFLRFTNPAPVSETVTEVGNRKATLFTWISKSEIAKRWLFDDFDNNRWVELSINRRNEIPFDEGRFLNSLKFGEAIGNEIGLGSSVTLGDPATAVSVTEPKPSGAVAEEPMLIVNRNPALYPFTARMANTQGTVKLRIEFLASGAIGSITVTSGLPHGLTEAAVTAARKLTFLPRRVNGVPVTATRQVYYDFHIY